MRDFTRRAFPSRKRAISYLIAIPLCFLFFYAWIVYQQRSLIYFPETERPDPAAFAMPDVEVTEITTDDGLTLLSWYHPPAEKMPVIIMFHGNAQHHGYRTYKMRPFADQGYGVLLVGYRGYGGNPGNPSEQGFYSDARANIAWLGKTGGIPQNRMVLYGESIGSGVAVQMALEHREAALVLEAPFNNLAEVAADKFRYLPFARYAVFDKFKSEEKIAYIDCPLLVIIAGKDRVIPSKYGLRLFEAAREPKVLALLENAGHNDLYAYGAGEEILSFLLELEF